MKKTNKRARLSALMLCALLALTGCAQKEPIPAATAPLPELAPATATEAPAEPAAEADHAATIPADIAADAVLATVNGRPITRAEADDIAGNLMSVYASYGMDTSSAEAVAALRVIAVNTALQMQLMLQKGEEWGVAELSAQELQALTDQNHAEWEQVVSYLMAAAGATDAATEEEKSAARAAALAQLESMGYTEQRLLDSAVSSAKLEKIQAEMVKDIEVTDDELNAAYQAQVSEDEAAYKNDVYAYELTTRYMGKSSYYVPAGYRGVTQILLSVDQALLDEYQRLSAALEEQAEDIESGEGVDVNAQQVTRGQVDAACDAILDAVQPTVAEIRSRLDAGETFDSLIDQYNIDPGMSDPANRRDGYSVHMDSVIYDPAFVKAAFSVQEIGQVSEPAVGTYGVYIVCYLRDVPGGPVPLEDVRGELTERVLSTRENEVFNSTMDAWMAAADIAYTDAGNAYLSK